MNTSQHVWSPGTELDTQPHQDLVFAFGGDALMADPASFDQVRAAYPGAHIVGCSSCGEVAGESIHDGTIVLTAVQFAHTRIHGAQASRMPDEDDAALGERLAGGLAPVLDGLPLTHVLLFSDGVHLNGTRLVAGVSAALPPGVAVTGGLAGDSTRFVHTPVWGQEVLDAPAVVALGFYSERLRVGWGAVGGWRPLGPDRLVTRAEGNVLYTLNDRPALDLYEQYLGPHAEGLPATGLLFPLSIRKDTEGREIVRSTLDIDRAAGSLTFAAEVPEGTFARFMCTNQERLTDGATEAAEEAVEELASAPVELAILVSCVGRRLVMGPRTEDELEAVASVFGREACIAGFYSHGELAPFGGAMQCDLHNQTMTVTVFSEQ